jgi:hypothetical protein
MARCIDCGRFGVRHQETQQLARMMIKAGVPLAEANKPRCRRCVNELLRALPSKEQVGNLIREFAGQR